MATEELTLDMAIHQSQRLFQSLLHPMKKKNSENAKSKGGGEGGTSKPCHLALQRAGLN